MMDVLFVQEVLIRTSCDFNENQPKEGTKKYIIFSALLAGTKIMSK